MKTTQQWISVIAVMVVFFGNMVFSQTVYWEQTNGPEGGYMADILFRSTNDVILNVNDEMLFHSSDAGENWDEIPIPEPFSLRALAVDPNGDLWIGNDSSKLYKSSDNGSNWDFIGEVASDLVIYNFNFVGSDTIVLGTNDGVYQSVDGGQTWQNFWPGKYFFDIFQTNSGTLIAYIYSWQNPALPRIYQSANNGENWSAVSTMLSNSVSTVFVTGNDDMFVIRSDQQSVYRSSDNGATWDALSQGLAAGFQPEKLYNSGNPGDNKLYLIGINALFEQKIYHSYDNGDSWTELNNTIGDYILLIKVGSVGEVFVGTGNNLFRSTDNGVSWTPIVDGIVATSIQALATDNNNTVFASVNGQGILSSDDHGATWENRFQSTELISDIKIADDGTMFVKSYFGRFLMRSTDQGTTWEDVAVNMPANSSVVSLDFLQNGEMVVGGNGKILRSSDNGETWTSLLNIPNPHQATENNYVTTNPSGDMFLLPVVFGPEGFYRSTNNGSSWESIGAGIIDIGRINTLLIDDDGTIFAGMSVYDVPNVGPFLYRSTDNGTTWEVSDNGIQLEIDDYVQQIIADDNNLYLSTRTDVYRSVDNGSSWTSVKNGLRLSYEGVKALAVDGNGQLYAGVPGFGVFRSLSPITSVESNDPVLPVDFSLAQNYPNPFNPSTTIQFTIQNPARVSLKVHDLLGREVATLVDQSMASGTYQMTFDATGLSGGTYFYTLKAGDFSQTRKFTLVK